jgi:prevent-host-death family protein
MEPVNIHQAKTQLSKLIEAAEHGEEVIIARAGKPVVRLVPVGAARPNRRPGSLEGRLVIGDDFDTPLPSDILDAFEGK